MIDLSTEFGRRVQRRLREEHIIWLSTVSRDLTPQPRPVWFLWDGQAFLIFSQPNTHKLQHIAGVPKVALNFNSDSEGGDVIVFTGEATIASEVPPADEVAGFMEKYATDIADLGMSPREFAQSYSVAIRVTPASLRGF